MTPTISPPPVHFTDHAVTRYIERMRPGIDAAAAARDLSNMHEAMTFTPTPPAWLDGRLRHDADAFLLLGDVAFILRSSPIGHQSWYAVTCLVRGQPSDATRERHARRRRSPATRSARWTGRRSHIPRRP